MELSVYSTSSSAPCVNINYEIHILESVTCETCEGLELSFVYEMTWHKAILDLT